MLRPSTLVIILTITTTAVFQFAKGNPLSAADGAIIEHGVNSADQDGQLIDIKSVMYQNRTIVDRRSAQSIDEVSPVLFQNKTIVDRRYAQKYLVDSGYMELAESSEGVERSLGAINNETIFKRAVELMQEGFGIAITGDLNEKTVELMKSTSCGVKASRRTDRNKRYQIWDKSWKWDSHTLKYRVYNTYKNAAASLKFNDVEPIIQQQADKWKAACNFQFIAESNPTILPEVKIEFKSRDHGDWYPFDGPDGDLAHALLAGDIHIDFDEVWSPIKLGKVMLHEMGHVLGLAHSSLEGSVMYARISETTGTTLTQDDIDGCRAMHGPPT